MPQNTPQLPCSRCADPVECEDITGPLCSNCWLEDEELRQMAHINRRIERGMDL